MFLAPETMASLAATALVRDLCAEVRGLGAALTTSERARATLRLSTLSALLLGGAWLYWRLPLGGGAAIRAVLIAGVAYGLLLIATHEMVHGTLLGFRTLEQWLACLLSWPMAWLYLTYARLHHLHHCWNRIHGCRCRLISRHGTVPLGPPRREVCQLATHDPMGWSFGPPDEQLVIDRCAASSQASPR